MRPSGMGSLAQSAGQPSMKQDRSSSSSASARSATRRRMLAQCFGVGAGRDRQDVGEQSSRGGVGHERRPARLQIEPLRRDMIGDQSRAAATRSPDRPRPGTGNDVVAGWRFPRRRRVS